MIQRIQSLFLLVVVFLTGLMFLFDFSNFEKGVETSGFNVCGIENVCTTWPLAILNFLILAIALYTINDWAICTDGLLYVLLER